MPAARPTETVDVRPGRPAVVYYRRRDVGRGVAVLDVVPALTALRDDGERCRVASGDPRGLFDVTGGRFGVSSLQFAASTVDVGVYRVQVTCRPLGSGANQPPFTFDVELHVH